RSATGGQPARAASVPSASGGCKTLLCAGLSGAGWKPVGNRVPEQCRAVLFQWLPVMPVRRGGGQILEQRQVLAQHTMVPVLDDRVEVTKKIQHLFRVFPYP